ncbi:hypothetical protein GZ77_26575 [Endozoicomonas montiporae]|uniref:Tail sheath protein C-terminal domain-containing protein n=1 Tax=Endozoicomonas montiporae TaxID=1027273 RepID=A0A081MYF3_9GAMM|nr:phage tail sheath C-terminal domain-containing protein [Endozoicomonas montiporae]KEQ11226.1 hypothetical protein GZ77_26575 [Endozoicomonas montiporae]
MADYLHGVEHYYVDNDNRPIEILAASTIGLVATADDAQEALQASVTLGTGNSAVTFTAVEAGIPGNIIAVEVVKSDAASAELSVSLAGDVITVSLATDDQGDIDSTAADVATAVNNDNAVKVRVQATAGGDGSGAMGLAYLTYLSGGENEAFPLNTPVMVTSRTQIGKAGESGTLKQALGDIYTQSGAVTVVVRVAEGQNETETKANVIGSYDPETGKGTGLQTLLGAEAALGVIPRLLIATDFSHLSSVGEAMETVARDLNAIPIIDTDLAWSFTQIVTRARQLAESALLHGGVKYFDTAKKTYLLRHGSACVAGHIVRVDNEEGYWNSASNRRIYNIEGTAVPVEYVSKGPYAKTCLANQLNANNVMTIVNKQGGWYLWGNRLTNGVVMPHQRIRYIVGDSIVEAHQSYVDRNATGNYMESVKNGVNRLLRRLRTRNVISGGECWIDQELNQDAIGTGQVFWDYDLGFYDVAERLTFRQHVTDRYNESIFS